MKVGEIFLQIGGCILLGIGLLVLGVVLLFWLG
jgi:hypothetical protein